MILFVTSSSRGTPETDRSLSPERSFVIYLQNMHRWQMGKPWNENNVKNIPKQASHLISWMEACHYISKIKWYRGYGSQAYTSEYAEIVEYYFNQYFTYLDFLSIETHKYITKPIQLINSFFIDPLNRCEKHDTQFYLRDPHSSLNYCKSDHSQFIKPSYLSKMNAKRIEPSLT